MHLSEKMRNILIVIGLYLLTASIHFLIVSQQGIVTESTYADLRILDAVTDNEKSLFFDSLSMGGRESYFNPTLFYLISPLWSFASSIQSFLFMISLLVAAVSVFLYLFLKKYEEKRHVCFAFALLGSVNPLIFGFYAKGLFVTALYIPLTLLFFLCFFSYTEHVKSYMKVILILILTVLVLVSAHMSFVLLVLFCVFGLFLFEGREINHGRKELFLYLILVFIFGQYLIYQKLFSQSGLSSFFSSTLIETTLYGYFFNLFSQIVLPFLVIGLYAYSRSFRIRTNPFVLFSFCLFSVSLLLFLLKSQFSFLFVTYGFIALVLTGPPTYRVLWRYWEKSKISHFTAKLNAVFLVFFLFFTLLLTMPFLSETSEIHPLESSELAYAWITQNTLLNAQFFVSEYTANEFMYFTDRKTFADSSSLKSVTGKKRIVVQTKLYQTSFESFALNLIKESMVNNNSQFIIWDESYLAQYGQKPLFLGGMCFPKIYAQGEFEIYGVNCLEERNE